MNLLRPLRYVVAALLLLPLASVASAQKQPTKRDTTKRSCAAGEVSEPKSGKCVKQAVCGPDQELVLNKCFPKCPEGMKMDNAGRCFGCRTGEVEDPKSGKCVKQAVCGPDQEAVLNKCLPKCPEGTQRDARGGCRKPGANPKG